MSLSLSSPRTNAYAEQAAHSGFQTGVQLVHNFYDRQRRLQEAQMEQQETTIRYKAQLENALALKEAEARNKIAEFNMKSTEDRHKQMWGDTMKAYDTNLTGEISSLMEWKKPDNAWKLKKESHALIDAAIAERQGKRVSAASMVPTTWTQYVDPTPYLTPAVNQVTQENLQWSDEYKQDQEFKRYKESLGITGQLSNIPGTKQYQAKTDADIANDLRKKSLTDLENSRITYLNNLGQYETGVRDYHAMSQKYIGADGRIRPEFSTFDDTAGRYKTWEEIAYDREGDVLDEADKPVKRFTVLKNRFEKYRMEVAGSAPAYLDKLASPLGEELNPFVSRYIKTLQMAPDYNGLRSGEDIVRAANEVLHDHRESTDPTFKAELGKVYEALRGVPLTR